MKTMGYLLLVGGFLAAAYFTVLDVQETRWPYFIPSALVLFTGIYILKKLARGEARSEHVLQANKSELTESLGNIVAGLEGLTERVDSIATPDLRDEIDDALRDDLRRFADARESMIHLYGIQAYADIMSEFAAGERYVNRVWSASADDYRNEATSYLEKALGQFRDAFGRLERARS
jgi:hypothetical protein